MTSDLRADGESCEPGRRCGEGTLGRRNSKVNGPEEGMGLMSLGKQLEHSEGAEVRGFAGADRVGPAGRWQDSRKMGTPGGL